MNLYVGMSEPTSAEDGDIWFQEPVPEPQVFVLFQAGILVSDDAIILWEAVYAEAA